MVVQADDKGDLLLPRALLPEPAPLATYIVREKDGQTVIVKETQPTTERPFWEAASPEERLAALREWLKEAGTPAGLSDYAVSRDSIYD